MSSLVLSSAQPRANSIIIALLLIAMLCCTATAIPNPYLPHMLKASPVPSRQRGKAKCINCNGNRFPSSLTTKERMEYEANHTQGTTGGTRLVVLLAAIPYVLSVTAYIMLVVAAWYSSLSLVTMSLVASFSTKVLAIPVGLFLLGYGFIAADVETSLLGTSIFTFLADSMGIGRLWVVLRSSFKFRTMQRWYRHKSGKAVVLDNSTTRGGHEVSARKMVALATGAEWNGALLGTDKVIIALLATKFVLLTEKELNWRRVGTEERIRDLSLSKERWVQAFDGEAGDWARDWTRHVDHGDPEAYEHTLRFVIMLFCCVRRAFIIGEHERAREKKALQNCLEKQRDEEGDMSWVYTLMRELGNDTWEESIPYVVKLQSRNDKFARPEEGLCGILSLAL